MKRTALLLAGVVVGISGIARLGSAVDAEKGAPLDLVVSLLDGTRVVGVTSLTTVSIQSETLGKLEVSLNKIRGITFSLNHESATVALVNGDRLEGRIGTAALPLRTLFGAVKIPVATVKELEVVSVATGAELSKGLVAYYTFNGDAEDHSGNNNHGTVVGATFENVGTTKALHLSGNGSSYVAVQRSNSLEPTTGLSISMWCNGVPGQACGNGWGVILRKANSCNSGYFFKGCNTSSFYIDPPNPCRTGGAKSVAFLPFTGTNWQHVVGTYSVTDGMLKSYENGVLVNQTPYANPLAHSGDLYIGGSPEVADDGGFKGLINEVRIYNRALSAAEIRALWGKGSPAR